MCNCISKIDDKLRESGIKIADSCSGFQITESLSLKAHHCLPLQRVDGKRLKRTDAKSVIFPYCPFCGQPYDPAKEQ